MLLPDIKRVRDLYISGEITSLTDKQDLFTFSLALGLFASLLKGLHLTLVTTIIEHHPFPLITLTSNFTLLAFSLALGSLLNFRFHNTDYTTLPLLLLIAISSSLWTYTYDSNHRISSFVLLIPCFWLVIVCWGIIGNFPSDICAFLLIAVFNVNQGIAQLCCISEESD